MIINRAFYSTTLKYAIITLSITISDDELHVQLLNGGQPILIPDLAEQMITEMDMIYHHFIGGYKCEEDNQQKSIYGRYNTDCSVSVKYSLPNRFDIKHKYIKC